MRWRSKQSDDAPPTVVRVSLPAQILAECHAMASYALTSGLRVPAGALHAVADAEASGADDPSTPRSDAERWRRLVRAHEQLVQAVSPATPRTLLLLSEDAADGKLQMLGGVPLVRRMLGVSIVTLAIFLVTALSPDVNQGSGNIFRASGWDLLVNELFLLSAAGIGAAFAALFAANHYIAQGTYDPKYESSYWVRFVLGLIAGIVLASLVPVKTGAGGGESFTRPFLALLGGFSAAVVFRILQRVVSALESLVQGDSTERDTATKRLATSEAFQARTQDQVHVVAALVKLREQLASGTPSQQVLPSLNALLDDMLPTDVAGPDI
ncbi:MAG: hypothetical protein QOJ46_1383 [bacterium]|jgi:hypothetical protein